jgi:hypothetical protein
MNQSASVILDMASSSSSTVRTKTPDNQSNETSESNKVISTSFFGNRKQEAVKPNHQLKVSPSPGIHH